MKYYWADFGGNDMKNIINYVEEEKSPFSIKIFSGVDSLVLSQLAYLNFDGFVPSITDRSDSVTIESIATKKNNEDLYRHTRASMLNKKLLFALGGSPRFRDIRINYYVNKLDYASEKQFSAVTFHLSDGVAYIAYRGTDSTFVGWKEDFNMSFSSTIPSQKESAIYLNNVGRLITGRLRIGGHSKGGNLAVYAAMKCESSIQSRIIDIFSHDGPGFREEIFYSLQYQKIKEIIHHYIPQSALIGMMLEHHQKYVVVKSKRIGIMQHDPFSWIIEDGDFQYQEDINNMAIIANKTLQLWLDSLNDQNRELFVDILYSVINATGAKTFSDLTVDMWGKALAVLSAIRNIDEETKHFVAQTVRELIFIAVKSFR